jgi:hypothetical protein
MKKIYVNPELELIELADEDVIRTSPVEEDPEINDDIVIG